MHQRLPLPAAESLLLAVPPRLHRLAVDVLEAQRLACALSVSLVCQVGEESFFNATGNLGNCGIECELELVRWSPPLAENALVPRLECGDVCLLNNDGTESSTDRCALFSST